MSHKDIQALLAIYPPDKDETWNAYFSRACLIAGLITERELRQVRAVHGNYSLSFPVETK